MTPQLPSRDHFCVAADERPARWIIETLCAHAPSADDVNIVLPSSTQTRVIFPTVDSYCIFLLRWADCEPQTSWWFVDSVTVGPLYRCEWCRQGNTLDTWVDVTSHSSVDTMGDSDDWRSVHLCVSWSVFGSADTITVVVEHPPVWHVDWWAHVFFSGESGAEWQWCLQMKQPAVCCFQQEKMSSYILFIAILTSATAEGKALTVILVPF